MLCQLLSPQAHLPVRKSEGAAGLDLAYAGEQVVLEPGERRLFSTGIAIAVPPGYYGQIAPRSGLALNCGIMVMGGIIDSDYRGEVGVVLYNSGKIKALINSGDRIAQLILIPCFQVPAVQVETLSATERAEAGFGSTGK